MTDDAPDASSGARTSARVDAQLLRRVRAATVEAMLKREDQLRVCGSVQRLLRAAVAAAHAPGWHPAAAAARQHIALRAVIDAVQAAVGIEFGLNATTGRTVLRHAPRWIGARRAKQLSLYRRHNRLVRERELVPAEGDAAPLSAVPPLALVSAPDSAQADSGASQSKSTSQTTCERAGTKTQGRWALDLALLGGAARPLVLVAASGS